MSYLKAHNIANHNSNLKTFFYKVSMEYLSLKMEMNSWYLKKETTAHITWTENTSLRCHLA